MKCLKCNGNNPEDKKFCRKCGANLAPACPQCGAEYLPGDSYCGECGARLEAEAESAVERADAYLGGERKQVTVVFCDLSGYTAMSEKLDPEEVRGITSRIFSEAARIVADYEGYVDKFMGDAVMALFGVPKSHEDDPIRAIRAAMAVHELVRSMSPQVEPKIGRSLAMHTGVNTGLVVTGEIDLQKGSDRVLGDTINVASRLTGLAEGGEILVGEETYHQAQGYFDFEVLAPVRVKGKREPIQPSRVLSVREKPVTIHHISGLRANLIGRKAELAQLEEAIVRLKKGKGTVVSICGEAGTGKSRLVDEFKASPNLEKTQWREGYAYAYSQNIPHFLLMDLFNRAWKIEESDPPEKVRAKVEAGVGALVRKWDDIVPFIGSLYSLEYPQIEGMDPQYRKSRLYDGVREILSALCKKTPTVICLDDLHWADPSSAEMLRAVLSEFTYPAVFLCVQRPEFSLLSSSQITSLGDGYREIQLQRLSSSETQQMLEGLLDTKDIPLELQRSIQDRIEGNPFYLEEVVNSLTETGTLVRDNGSWKLSRPINDFDVPTTIHGVISTRLDHLETATKRIIQEASVIGRAFFYDILKRITELEGQLDTYLRSLEVMDLIRTRSMEPDLEYIFKHALTQEVVYNGLLKQERQVLHEKVALTTEQLFPDRITEFCETLAFHYAKGGSREKAIHYLIQSARKSLERYSVEESHRYCREAFDLLGREPDKTRTEQELTIDLINQWALVFYYRGDFKGMTEVLTSHRSLAESLDDKARLGMFYAWLGYSLYERARNEESYQYLQKALHLGEEINDERVIGLACAWLALPCWELGHMAEGISCAERGRVIGGRLADGYIYFKSIIDMVFNYWVSGNRQKCQELGKTLIEYGHKHGNIRSQVVGHISLCMGHDIDGQYALCIGEAQKAMDVSVDPFYYQWAKLHLCSAYAESGDSRAAENAIEEVASYCEEFGNEQLATIAAFLLGAALAGNGQFGRGIKTIEDAAKLLLVTKRTVLYAMCEGTLGRIYLQIAEGTAPVSLSVVIKNIGFIARNVPCASGKAERHFRKAIEVSEEIGAKLIAGRAYRDLASLHKLKRRAIQAQECISTAIRLFGDCDAQTRVREAKELLASALT